MDLDGNHQISSISIVPEEDTKLYKVGTMADAMRLAWERAKATTEELDDPDPDPYGYTQELEQELGREILADDWKARPDDARWVRRVKARARKAEVTKMLIQGYKVPEIARACKVSEMTVLRDVNSVQMEWRRTYLEEAETMAARDMDRLEYYLTKLIRGIEAGDVKSINAAVEIIRERGNILGYRQGMQVDIEQQIREVAESQGYDPERAIAAAQRISISFK